MDFKEIFSKKTQVEDGKTFYLEGKTSPDSFEILPLPKKGKVKNYILTSAQNNTMVIEPLWNNILVLAKELGVEIIVAPLHYKKNLLNTSNERVATEKGGGVTFDSIVQNYMNGGRLRLSPDLDFFGDMGFSITARNPLTSMDRFLNHKELRSLIFPSNKMGLEVVPQSYAENIKNPIVLYSTPTVTGLNFIDSKAGKIGENETTFGCLVASVNDEGESFVYQVEASKEDFSICYKDFMIKDGVVHKTKLAIVNGDAHSFNLTQEKIDNTWGENGLAGILKPELQVVHDVLDQYSCNHHHEGNDVVGYIKHHKKTNNLSAELSQLTSVLSEIASLPNSKLVVVESNHDNALIRYLDRIDPKKDYQNALLTSRMLADKILFTTLVSGIEIDCPVNADSLDSISAYISYKKRINQEPMFLEWVLGEYYDLPHNTEYCTPTRQIEFISTDVTYEYGGVLLNLHGDKGVNGARGYNSLRRLPVKVVHGHGHATFIRGNVISVGVTADIDKFEYASGPSNWIHAHVVIYANGSRCVLIEKNGKFFH